MEWACLSLHCVMAFASVGTGDQEGHTATPASDPVQRPNILFAIADDWGWPDAGAYGTPVVATPTFDRVANEGVLFEHAFVSSPSCTPSRAAILTGQFHWRLEESASLWSTLQTRFRTYPELLAEAGYHVGHTRKGWGPGRLEPGGRDVNPAGPKFPDFERFLAERPDGAPFCFWFGSHDPHRGYKAGTGAQSGMDLSAIEVPPYFPDAPEVRSDLADYYFEVQRFDTEVGELLATLEEMGELERTVVVITGDHGRPFPRCKANLYDSGSRVPLVVRFGESLPSGRRVTDFVSLTDLAPTFLDFAGLEPGDDMTGSSLVPLIESPDSGRIDPRRDHVVFGRERHVPAQAAPNLGGYPARALRNDRWLYIRNFEPELWPAGVFEGSAHRIKHFPDCDDGPTKRFLIENESAVQVFHQYAFGQRPAIELYDLGEDPHQLRNVAVDPAYEEVLDELGAQLMTALRETDDPRVVGGAERFDAYPYYGSTKRK